MSALVYRRYGSFKKVTLRHLPLLEVVEELKKGFPLSQYLRVTALDDMVSTEYA